MSNMILRDKIYADFKDNVNMSVKQLRSWAVNKDSDTEKVNMVIRLKLKPRKKWDGRDFKKAMRVNTGIKRNIKTFNLRSLRDYGYSL